MEDARNEAKRVYEEEEGDEEAWTQLSEDDRNAKIHARLWTEVLNKRKKEAKKQKTSDAGVAH